MRFENLAAGVTVGGKYRLDEILGRGSYGDVWKAKVLCDDQMPEYVAIKFFTNQDRALKVYLDEADRIRSLDHPGIVKIYEAGKLDGLAMISMEYVPGHTLLQRLGDSESPKPVSLNEALNWAQEIAELLAYLHDRQPAVMHCDLKLDNLLLGDQGRVHLIDFGQSRTIERLFVETSGVGAYPYLAPELLGLDRDRKSRRYLQSDVYAFGVILYRMLTGSFPRATLMEVHNLTPIRRPSEVNHRIPKQLEEFVMACLETRPDRRPANGKELLGRLLSIRDELVARVTSDVTPTPASVERVVGQADLVADLARQLLQEGKVDEAIDQLERALQRMSTAPTVLMVYAEAARRAKKFDAARLVYQRIRHFLEMQGASDDVLREAIEGFGEVSVQLKKYEEAAESFQWLVARWPNKKWYRFRYGVTLGVAGQYNKSLEILITLQQDHPGLAAICAKIGFAYLQLKRYDEAKQYFNEALMLDEHDAFTLYHLARLRALQGRPDLAERYYERLLGVDEATDLAAELGRLLGKSTSVGD